MKQIIIEVSNEGEITIETRGFKGKVCIIESQFIKEVLGKEISCTLTPTYWQENNASIKKYLPLCG